MTQNRVLYLAGSGMITAIGGSTEMVWAAAGAQISRYATSSYFTGERRLIVQALVPDEALPLLPTLLERYPELTLREQRMLAMSTVAAAQALRPVSTGSPIPLLYAGPEVYPGVATGLSDAFLPALYEQLAPGAIDARRSRAVSVGRPGAIEAIKLAFHYAYDIGHNAVLVGGADSYQFSPLLAMLDGQKRLAAQHLRPHSGSDAFAPGEAAGYLCLTPDPEKALIQNGRRVALTEPGFGYESGHWFSDKPYRGEGLDQAFKQALAGRPTQRTIKNIYSSANGERFWGKELGVALTRNHHLFDDPKVHHPAEYYGDIGAATGAVLVALAGQTALSLPGDDTHLIYGSADQSYRGAIYLQAEGVAA